MQKVSTPKVVWVAQWYPHEGQPYTGDFIQRHAKALALYLPVHVFACFPHHFNHEQTTTTGNLTETIIYFKPTVTPFKKLTKLLHWNRWRRLLQKAVSDHCNQHGKPDWIHCHIILNAGWLGLWAKRKWGIPYILTEHWSGYMPGAPNGFGKYNFLSKRLFHVLVARASCITAVSEALLKELQLIDQQAVYKVLPNVVNEKIFRREKTDSLPVIRRLIHISTFSFHKNIPVMLAAFDQVAVQLPGIEFHLVGPKGVFQQKFAKQASDPHYVLHGEITQTAIADLIRMCDACVLYSHYETFGCVLIEANAAGVPVIVSDIPVFREIIRPNENGMLVTPNDAEALAAAICSFYSKKLLFNGQDIAEAALNKFAFPVVGQQLADLYSASNRL